MFNANTALNQLTASQNGSNRLNATIGAYNFMQSEKESFVSFKFKASRKFNYCKITLNANDTYKMEISKLNSMKKAMATGEFFAKTETFEMLYDDQLKEIFEQTTKLYLSF